MWNEPKIDVRIPHESGGRLGEDLNRILHDTRRDWVWIIDGDVLWELNQNAYRIGQEAIRQQPDAGMFTNYCNRMGCKEQMIDRRPVRSTDIAKHWDIATQRFKSHGFTVTQWLDWGQPPGGFSMLINVKAAHDVGGFPGEGQFEEDQKFARRLRESGYGVYRMEGLYMYHFRRRHGGTLIPDDKTAVELWAEYKAAKT